MAFVDPNAPETQQQPVAQQNPQAPVSAGGAGAAGSPSKSPATPGVNVPAQPSAQLSAYIAANQPQASAMAGNVAGQVAGQVNAAGQAIQPAVDAYKGNLYSVAPDAGVNAKVAASPSSLTPEERATYQKEIGAAAAAPNSASTFETSSGYQDAARKVQDAVSTSGLWNAGNDIASISTALGPFEGGNATQGDRQLDALLLSQTPEAYSQIQAATAPAAALQGQLSTGTQDADAALRAAIAQDQATSPAATASAQQYVTGLNKSLADYLSRAQNDATAYNTGVNNLSQTVAGYQPDIAALQDAVAAFNASIGSGGAGSLLSPINLPAINYSPSVVSPPDVGALASSQQYSDIQALQDILGPGGFAALNSTITPATASEAGTYSSPINNLPTASNLIAPLIESAFLGNQHNIGVINQHELNGAGGPNQTDTFGNIVGAIPNLDNEIFGSSSGSGAQNPALLNYVPGVRSIESYLDALDSALQGNPAANVNPAVTPGTPAPPPTPPGPNPYPTSPNGTVPDQAAPIGSPAYNLWLRDTYINSPDIAGQFDENGNTLGGIHAI